MPQIDGLFPTLVFQGELSGKEALNRALLQDVKKFAREDKAGKAWSDKHYRNGYTSYASLCDLQFRSPTFAKLAELLQPQADRFARELGWDLSGNEFEMTALWMNVMEANAYHTLHLHPHSVLSGTYYVSVPKGSVSLKLEDPRMPFYMNAPVRVHGKHNSLYHEVRPKPGAFVLFESWLRHEVPPNRSREPRVSVSFNYGIKEREET